MKKYFVTSDVHSFYTEMRTALLEKGWEDDNPNHVFVSLGDLMDRGPDARLCLEFVNRLPGDRKILIRGNHEDLLQMVLNAGYLEEGDLHNRTNDTIAQLMGDDSEESIRKMRDYEPWNTYDESCVDYAEIGDNIFVHGWIPSDHVPSIEQPGRWSPRYIPDWREADKTDWNNARWFNGMLYWALDVKEPGKTIWCGHFHTSWGHCNLHGDGVEFLKKIETYYIDPETGKTEPHCNFEPFVEDGIVAMDACVAYSGFLNCLTFEA